MRERSAPAHSLHRPLRGTPRSALCTETDSNVNVFATRCNSLPARPLHPGIGIGVRAKRNRQPHHLRKHKERNPHGEEKAPVVIVIQEILGLTDWIRAVADRLAAEGFIAIAPDLLSGKGPGGGGTGKFGRRADSANAG